MLSTVLLDAMENDQFDLEEYDRGTVGACAVGFR